MKKKYKKKRKKRKRGKVYLLNRWCHRTTERKKGEKGRQGEEVMENKDERLRDLKTGL